MKKIVVVLCCLMPLFSHAQIKFSTGRNWQEVLDQAKKGHKRIFIDLYASWCGPCKMMDRDVYSDKAVGDLVNANFIAVKVQMDSTKKDNEFVRGWYADAANWKLYVDAYPSFLFYSADGEYPGKNVGYYAPKDFLTMLKKVLDPKGSYLAQVKEFENGSLNDNQLLRLAYLAYDNRDTIAFKIGKEYKTRYLDKKIPMNMLTVKTLPFFAGFSILYRLNDPVIMFIYKNQASAEKAFGADKGWAKGYINFLLKREMRRDEALIQIAGLPDWENIEKKFAKLLDPKTSKAALISNQIYYEAKKGNWDRQAKYEYEQVDFRGLDPADLNSLETVNDMLWEMVFAKVTNKDILNQAIKYMEVIIQAKPENHHFLDTYANLLYKLGNNEKALEQELKAMSLAKNEKDLESVKSYEDVVNNIKTNKPTW